MSDRNTFLCGALILALGVALGGYFVGHGLTSREAFNRFISVKGLAEKTVKADQATWQMTVGYSANNLPSLYAGISAAQNAAKAFWIKEGFDASEIDLQSASINDNQVYNSNNGGPHYTASAVLILITPKVDQVKTASQALNLLVKENVVLSNSQINYSFTHLNDIKPAMLDAATTNAHAAADAFAKNANDELKGIRTASQGQFTISNDNDSGISSVMKQVRVVTSVDYFLGD
jgi:hypothetical protein